jgi:hypothetical protein
MEQQFQTSFIPKKPLTEEPVAHTRPVSLFTFITTILFFASLVLGGGVYFYKTYLTKQATELEKSLVVARASFEPKLVSDLSRLDKRINTGNELLSTHVTVSPIFELFQDITIQTIRFTKFNYAYLNDSGTAVNVKMSGLSTPAGGYSAIANQSDLLNKNKYIKNAVFSNLTLDDKGNITFDLTFSVDPTFVLYSKLVSGENVIEEVGLEPNEQPVIIGEEDPLSVNEQVQ